MFFVQLNETYLTVRFDVLNGVTALLFKIYLTGIFVKIYSQKSLSYSCQVSGSRSILEYTTLSDQMDVL